MRITDADRVVARNAFFLDHGGKGNIEDMRSLDKALDALAAMPEPGCEGCKSDDPTGKIYYTICNRCNRNTPDHYAPKEAKE